MMHRLIRVPGYAFFLFAGSFRFPPADARRGQTRVESAVTLGVLIVAGVGAWMLYKDAIVETTKAMIGFFGSDESG